MLKIAVTGPESVGKSTLSFQLAVHFNGQCIPEFAREYVSNLGRHYQYEDVETIARNQVDEYQRVNRLGVNNSAIVIFDTFLIITKVWFDVVYHRHPQWLNEAIQRCPMDFFLLCSPDIPWISDGIRENGDTRDELFERYRQELDNYGFKYHIITGTGQNRLEMAISIVERYKNQLNDTTSLSSRVEENH
jgi:NadR type nicotinamide-nucleotide adenylyltransferase